MDFKSQDIGEIYRQAARNNQNNNDHLTQNTQLKYQHQYQSAGNQKKQVAFSDQVDEFSNFVSLLTDKQK